MAEKDSFDDFKSKIRELHIPLPNFKKYFHKPSSEEEVFENFVGREDISEQLEEWLISDSPGAYLVTGYRGMGKSSFVGKVLNKITKPKNKRKNNFFNLFCLLFIISFVLWVFTFANYGNSCLFLICPFITLVGGAIIFIRDRCEKKRNEKRKKKIGIEDKYYKSHKSWFEKVFKIKDIKGNKHNIVIKLNLGHESLKEREILSLIAKRIYDTCKEYLNDFYTNWVKIIFRTISLFCFSILIVSFLEGIDITSFLSKPMADNNTTLHSSGIINNGDEINNSGVISSNNSTSYNSSNLYVTFYKCVIGITSQETLFQTEWLSPLLIIKIILVIVFYFLSRKLWNFAVNQIPFFHKYSTTVNLEKLKSLIDRIESTVTENSGPNSGYTHSSSLFSFNFSRRKNKTYPIASSREIEDELIQILDKINTRFFKIISPPKFIIVFDELDKIDPVYNQVIKTEQDIPEFESGVDFQGSSAIRDRKQNILKLLGNMKLFMSQAKAKFVFIAGRELYDAFLADLADREFAASSIFNGVIYVDSFLESSTKEKNILTKTEEYICRYLIPKEWYIGEAKKRYYEENGKVPDNPQKEAKDLRKKLKNITYHNPDLRMYKKYLIKTLIKEGYLKNKNIKILKDKFGNDNDKFESYKEFIYLYKDTLSKRIIKYPIPYFTFFFHYQLLEKEEKDNLLSEIKDIFLFIDKTIVFLKQFSFYLTHVCNGSPKKITIYFEQYIKPFISEHNKNPFLNSKDKDIKKCPHCLSFSANDQQKIGFIYYIAYPITQTIINNTSHFGDKMLVSTSFLIDHIFKHHKGGFSYEDIEHTPELLEVYHIPDLRDVIDGIFSFLRQNHITDIYGGIYQYKFRKYIADEIKYNARVSGEISAMFNFTLDESLPIKRYFYKQIKENERKYLALEEGLKGSTTLINHTANTPTSATLIRNQYAFPLVAQLDILGEVHLLDEEYNEAIQHLQTAFEIIKLELKRVKTDKNKLHLHVLLNRAALKLGLAKERKGYYNEAFVIYNNLLDYLTIFRYLKEKEFGLNYFYEDNDLENGKYRDKREWKAKKAKVFHNFEGKIDFKDNFYEKDVLPLYRKMQEIKKREIDFLLDSDYLISGLSNMLSHEKQEIISRLTLFSEVKSIFQVILANLFVVEKIDLNGITQENLDLAENQFKYIYLFTDSKDKFIQAADFYKKMASILFLKNYSNPRPAEFLQMWGFNIYETINEFCFIYSKDYEDMIAGKFPKEILTEFFVDNKENLFEIFVKKSAIIGILITIYINNIDWGRKIKLSTKERTDIRNFIDKFISFGIEKRKKYFADSELKKINKCYECCTDTDRNKNHPCYACNYVSISLRIFRKVFADKYHLIKYRKNKSYFFKLLECFRNENASNNYFFVLASALRIKADISLCCVNGKDDNKLSPTFLDDFLKFIEKYYDDGKIIDDFIENDSYSKLEKTILYYWLSAEYFYLNNSPVDSNESLTKILIIFVNYLGIKEELHFEKERGKENINKEKKELFEKQLRKIQDTIVKRVLRNSNNTNNNVNYIEIQSLKYILRNREVVRICLSNLSTIANVEEILFAYCKLELKTKDINSTKDTIYWDCYKSTLLSPHDLSFTFQEKILSFEFKERMNMKIFENIFNKEDRSLYFYDEEFQIKYFKFLEDYLDLKTDIDKNIKELLGILPEDFKDNIDAKIRLLQFLISDSLYCLTQIIEILSSGRFVNFSYSFIGDIYQQISQWATLYHFTFNALPPYNEEEKHDITTFAKDEAKTICKRMKKDEETNYEKKLKELIEGSDKYEYKDGIINTIKQYYKNNPKKDIITDKFFKTNILNDIGTGNRQFLVSIYSVGMAFKYYHKVLEIHHEGKEYKEMIKRMYIVDDDISNGMHNFSLALERYTMNCGLIEEKMNKLREHYKDSLSYPLTNYLKDTTNFEETNKNSEHQNTE